MLEIQRFLREAAEWSVLSWVCFISLHPNCSVGKPTWGKHPIPTSLIVTVLLSLVLVHDDKTHICSHILFIIYL